MENQAYIYVSILTILLIACVTDLRWRKIYNWLTLPSLVILALMHPLFAGADQLLAGMVGSFVLFGISFGLSFIIRGSIGGGDMKLNACIGMAVGSITGLKIVMLTFILAAIISIPYILVKKFKTDRETLLAIPMAPFSLAATVIVLLFSYDLYFF